ncbi:hypothetical protein L3X38_033037 [Prunus dulcis]|uniref:Uncharacterized protein n=1 Tax=Prunus dulcis TaxID=3755 RepID=A0AAD4YWL4_PRUDU|nr:hypothetical protein L3X38_033037 [Prunus dulcis]
MFLYRSASQHAQWRQAKLTTKLCHKRWSQEESCQEERIHLQNHATQAFHLMQSFQGALGGLRKEFIAIKPFTPYKVLTRGEKCDPRYCRYLQFVGHPTTACQTLRKILHAKIHYGTLELPSRKQAFDEDPLPK